MRLFFALWPSLTAAEKLAATATEAARRIGGRATRRETLHLTLAFLGEVADEHVPHLCGLATGLSAPAFRLETAGGAAVSPMVARRWLITSACRRWRPDAA